MKDELKFIVIGVIKSLVQNNGLKLSTSVMEGMSDENNWICVDLKASIINQSTMWCFEYLPIETRIEKYFLQVELQTEFKTVVAINVITDEKNKLIKYS